MDDKKIPEQNNTEFGQKALRTYESDIAEAIQEHKATQVSISIAETKRKDRDEILSDDPVSTAKVASSIGRNIMIIFVSLILIAGGVLGGYYLYTISPIAAKPVEVQSTKSPSLVHPDFQKILDITGKKPEDIVNIIKDQKKAASLGQNNILEIIFGTKNSSTTQNLSRVGGPEFVSKIGLNPPDNFTRSLTFDWMFGLYNDGNSSQPFIILTTSFFQNTYSGLLKWEPVMADDLSTVLDIKRSNPTGTSSIESYFTLPGHFSDSTVKNKDVRVFKNKDNETQFIYAFIDNKTLIIARSVSTLEEVMRRIEQQTYVR